MDGFCDAGAVEIPDTRERILEPGDFILGGVRSGSEFQVGKAGLTAGSNNWPVANPPEHAIDEVGQKHLNFATLGAGFIVTPSEGSSIARSIQVWAGEGATDRDPASFEVWGTNQAIGGGAQIFPLSLFQQIASGSLALPAARNGGGSNLLAQGASQTVDFPNSGTYTSYLVLFPTVRNPSLATSVDVAEVALYTLPEPSATVLALATLAVLSPLRRRRATRSR